MCRYYFHIREGWRVVPDDEGMELTDIGEAWSEAYASADDLAHQAIRSGSSIGPCVIEIMDQAGNVLGTVKVSEQRLLA